MSSLRIVGVNSNNVHHWLEMAGQLWPDEKGEYLVKTISESISSERHQSFLCLTSADEPAGFIDLSLRTDYVEGCSTSPVGYIEGIFVKQPFRHQGIGSYLVREGEKWARSKGCAEFASDTELQNTDSQFFHKAIGFTHREVVVHFWKRID